MQPQPQTQIISGTVSATPFTAEGPVVGTRSEAAKIIGILTIVYAVGSAGLLFLGILGMAFLGEVVQDAAVEDFDMGAVQLVTNITSVIGLLSCAVMFYGGLQLVNYQKMGVYLTWGAIAVPALLTPIISFALLPEELSGGAVGLGVDAFSQVMCGSICAVIVAIPMMVSNGGLE